VAPRSYSEPRTAFITSPMVSSSAARAFGGLAGNSFKGHTETKSPPGPNLQTGPILVFRSPVISKTAIPKTDPNNPKYNTPASSLYRKAEAENDSKKRRKIVRIRRIFYAAFAEVDSGDNMGQNRLAS